MDNLKVDGQSSTQYGERVDKPLGRGLDDVSRLFLTKPAEPASSDLSSARSPERPSSTPAITTQPPRVLHLRPSTALTRSALASMMKELQDGLESGLRVLDTSVPCYPVGEIDLLAVDRLNQLTIIDFETSTSDALLLRGMAHYNWVLHNLPNMERMYAQQSINLLAEPRLILLAGAFSPMLTNAVRHLKQPRIHWVRYHVVEAMPGSYGILFERVSEG